MKKMLLLCLSILSIIEYLNAQQIGDNAEKVKYLVQMSVQEYYSAQGYHQVREDYKVLMSNGSMKESYNLYSILVN